MRHLVGLVAILLLGATALSGCSSKGDQTDLQVAPTLVAATPASSPAPAVSPAGTVLPLPGNASAISADPASDTLAVAISAPAEVLLYSLTSPTTPRVVVPLPGPVSHLSLAGASGPLLAAVASANQVVQITLPTGATSTLTVPGGPTSAAEINHQLLVAQPKKQSVAVYSGASSGAKLVRTISGDVTPEQVLGVGDQAVLVDQLQSALFDLNPTGSVGAGLRAGNGATNAVTDEYGRILVTDTRTGELLVFTADPVTLRQREPVAGSPYGIAYDTRRDLAWVTLTQLNQVVGYQVVGGEPVVKYRLSTVRQPNSVAVDPNSGRVFVASADGGGVQVIQP